MLDSTQLQQLHDAILAETDPEFISWREANEHGLIAQWYNEVDPDVFVVWRSTTYVDDIFDTVVWANLTPSDISDGTEMFTNRALIAQAKQLNLQILMQGRLYLTTGRATIRSALQDALTNIPTGVGGALQPAGWNSVRTKIQRTVTRGERVFASGTGTTATPGNLGSFEGELSNDDIVNAMRL